MSETNESLRTIFNEAIEIADARRRGDYLASACGGDVVLRQQVEALIESHHAAGKFLGGAGKTVAPTAPKSEGDSAMFEKLKGEIARDNYFVVNGDHTIRSFRGYELLEEIARGGMGIVYKARQVSLDRIVAVKLLLLGQYASEEFIHRFRMEASAAASLQHPNIVAIHEVGVHQGQHYFAMDFVDGPNLATLAKGEPLSAGRAARYLKIIAHAIHYAHEHGILHRDLKPSNVLIDSNDQPRVTDFGLAKRFGSDSPSVAGLTQLTLSGQVMGSPAYMPPEQASGARDKVDVRSNVYSLGATLYHLLTGRPPFEGASVAETLHQVGAQEPVPPRLLNAGVPLDLETICLKCLEKDMTDRYATALLVAEELARFENGEPIHARPMTVTNFHELRWADEKYVLQYRETVDYVLPDRQRMFQVLRSFFRHRLAGRRSVRVCDLGCGDGVLAAELLAVDPTIELTLVDGSADAVATARQRFGERASTVYLAATFDAIIRREVRLGPFDFIVSSVAIHHIHHAEKAVLFQRIIDELQPGGWFVNMDVTLPDQETLTGWMIELWRDQILEAERRNAPPRSCRTAPEQAWNDPDNKYATLGSQLKALRAAGFIEVDCLYRNGLFGIYSGRRPALSVEQSVA